jgi:hypothetical protein
VFNDVSSAPGSPRHAKLTSQWSRPIGLPDSPLSFQDLFSLDPEFLEFIPKPVKAVLLLFPSRGELADARKKEEADGQGKFSGDIWWIKQTVRPIFLHMNDTNTLGRSEMHVDLSACSTL